MKIVQTLAVTTATLALSFAAVDINPTQAATLNYNFTVNVASTSSFLPGATGIGSFTFDDSILTNSNPGPVQSLKLQLSGDPNIYTEKDDIAYPTFPQVFATTSLSSGNTVGLNYEFINKANPANPVVFQIIGDTFTISSDVSLSSTIGTGQIVYTQVPEPMAVSGIFLAGGIGWLNHKKKKLAASQKEKA